MYIRHAQGMANLTKIVLSFIGCEPDVRRHQRHIRNITWAMASRESIFAQLCDTMFLLS